MTDVARTNPLHSANIKVIGIGSGGAKALDSVSGDKEVFGVDLVAIDHLGGLSSSFAPVCLEIGSESAQRLGEGAWGRIAANKNREQIASIIRHAQMIIQVLCLGGRGSYGVAPVVADLVKESNALTVTVALEPWPFRTLDYTENPLDCIVALRPHVDMFVLACSQYLIGSEEGLVDFDDISQRGKEVLCRGAQAIYQPVTRPGPIKLDLANIKQFLSHPGQGRMGIGEAPEGIQAAKMAIESRLLHVPLEKSTSVLVSVASGPDLTKNEILEIAKTVKQASPQAIVTCGSSYDPTMTSQVRVTIIAKGVTRPPLPPRREETGPIRIEETKVVSPYLYPGSLRWRQKRRG